MNNGLEGDPQQHLPPRSSCEAQPSLREQFAVTAENFLLERFSPPFQLPFEGPSS